MKKSTAIWLGMIAANAVGAAGIAVTGKILSLMHDDEITFIMIEFIVLPLLMGLINTACWRKHRLSVGETFGICLANVALAIVLSAAFLGEGIICLIIVSPLIFLLLLGGLFIGRAMKQYDNNKLNASVALALVFLTVAGSFGAPPRETVVTDRMLIHASPEEVWKYVVAFPAIDTKPDYWLFRVGLPAPVQSTAEGGFVGAARQCIFDNGAVFEERITAYEPGRKLTFAVTKQPDDPEIMGHFQTEEGQFLLEDNGDGTTTLIGSSRYKLLVQPAFYFDKWAVDIVSHVHLRVMDHIRRLSEQTA